MRTEIVAGFAMVILAFGVVATWSLARQQRAVASMRLANEGYLRLAVQLVELRVNQGLFNTQLDQLLDLEQRQRVTSRAWMALARRSRRARLGVVMGLVRDTARKAADPDDVALLRRAAETLSGIDGAYAADEPRFDEMFVALSAGQLQAARDLEGPILDREDRCETALRGLMRDLQLRIQRLADEAEVRQRQSLQLIVLAIGVACVLGAVSTFTALRALRPLSRLRDRARAVARGDLSPVEIHARPDEIGELATEFERMVGAVAARDAALRAAHDRVLQAERLAAIGRMAAHVTHEVRNPLSSMALNAEMLADEVSALGPTAPEAERLVRAIQREIDRLTGITEEYLRVARLPKPRLEREDLAALACDAVGFVRKEMDAAGVAVRFEAVGDVGAVMLDEAQIRQSLLNLLRNAREAMENAQVASPSIVVRVASRTRDRGDEGAVIEVCDSGPGLADDAREHLFELFFTTKQRGSGLGLPLTREIVTAHGGEIHADRAPAVDGGGARFTLWFPLTRDRA